MKFSKFLFFLFFSATMICISCAKTIPVIPVVSPPIYIEPKFKVIGYVPEWAINLKAIQFDKLTHINYAFVLPTLTGDLKPLNDIEALKSLISIAHLKNVKVLVSIGGWNYGDDSAFISLTNNQTYTTNFINQVIKLVTTYDFDGVDIDWETPKVGVSDHNYTSLIKQLSSALRAKRKLLTIAVPPLDKFGIETAVFEYVDYLNIMAYDSFVDLTNQSSYSLAVASIAYWKGRGLKASKTILGVPFYGRARKNYDWTSYELYNAILAKGGNPNSDSFNGTGYNGISTIKQKTALALKEGAGIMIWELSGDGVGANSLLTAITESSVPEN